MAGQEAIFMNGEGDAWHHRNSHKPRHSVILDALMELKIRPRRALEFGCGQGFNIAEVVHTFDCQGHGIDPSTDAIIAARDQYSPRIAFTTGTASYRFLPTLSEEYDLLMYGFCLYVCDREGLASVVAIGDAALEDGGYLVIQDFDPEYPHKVPYHHHDGVFSYKMDYSKLWLANPAYSLVQKNIYADGEAVWVLKKDIAAGWPQS